MCVSLLVKGIISPDNHTRVMKNRTLLKKSHCPLGYMKVAIVLICICIIQVTHAVQVERGNVDGASQTDTGDKTDDSTEDNNPKVAIAEASEQKFTNKYGETNTDTGILDGVDIPVGNNEKKNLDKKMQDKGDKLLKYFCKHKDSCGLRPFLLRGPATVDSLNNGKDCYCNGPTSLQLDSDCYRGTCYNSMHSKPRPDGEQDNEGLCQYTIEDIASPTKCNNKILEGLDPNLAHYGENSATIWIPTKKEKSPEISVNE